MGIRFECPNGHKLHVKAFLAGKRGVCPNCGISVEIPQSADAPGLVDGSSASASATSVDTRGGPSQRGKESLTSGPVWYVRAANGKQFGPADSVTLRRWRSQGRVTADCLVWREGWRDWQSANTAFGPPAPPSPPSEEPAQSSANPVDATSGHHPRTEFGITELDRNAKEAKSIPAESPLKINVENNTIDVRSTARITRAAARRKSLKLVYALAVACFAALLLLIYVVTVGI